MTDMIQNHTFVGMADSVFGLLQHGTRLYLVNTPCVTKEMFYQQVQCTVPTMSTFHILSKQDAGRGQFISAKQA